MDTPADTSSHTFPVTQKTMITSADFATTTLPPKKAGQGKAGQGRAGQGRPGIDHTKVSITQRCHTIKYHKFHKCDEMSEARS
jgi:hypothetical protein